ATQMLESMITQPIPTRAEANDVATAVAESSDAVMLSAETATGSYPVEAVEMMDRICRAVEGHFPIDPLPEAEAVPDSIAEATARAASRLARTAGARLIAVFTRSGYTARQVARERPPVPIVALTGNEYVANQLALVWGVEPLVDTFEGDTEALISRLCARLTSDGYASGGERAVFVGSLEHHRDAWHTDLLHLREL
ncbi:MAG TPA: pyruvate kinase, partial [Thermomicrobiaceae bacterium]|nr:pyruvate kinase [Thermomicrobiaceae bacterium]